MKWPAAGLSILAALTACGFGAVLLNRAPAATPVRNDSAGAAGFAAWRGVNSCTAAACHGENPARGLHGSEYAVWAARDPHGRAYQVLFDPRSVEIQKNLNAYAPPENRPLAHQNVLCVRCHVAAEAETAVEAGPVWFSDGVGCESCHGAAGQWLAAHVGPGWRQLSAVEKAARGFRNTKDLVVRAKACTDCHVGNDRADVNHDLYAAGHPPLQYEYSSFLDRYRPFQHWSEADDRGRNPAYEAEAWQVGQAVTAQAGLRLLAARATAGRDKPWPEFAEYDCSSCHHGLEQQRFRNATRTHPGAPTWSWLASLTPLPPEPPSADQEKRLRDEMEKRDPNREKVAAWAVELAACYDRFVNQDPTDRPLDAEALRARLALLTGPKGQGAARGGWEEARRLSFAISAHERSLEAVEPDSRTAAAVRRLTRLLRPPAGWDVPTDFDAGRTIKALQDIHDTLGARP